MGLEFHTLATYRSRVEVAWRKAGRTGWGAKTVEYVGST